MVIPPFQFLKKIFFLFCCFSYFAWTTGVFFPPLPMFPRFQHFYLFLWILFFVQIVQLIPSVVSGPCIIQLLFVRSCMIQHFKKTVSTQKLKKRVQAGWRRWRWVSGLICQRRTAARVKGHGHGNVIYYDVWFEDGDANKKTRGRATKAMKTWRIFRFFMWVRRDRIRNQYIRVTGWVAWT